MKFAGVVTLYHPVIEDIINNIQSYLDELDILYVLDNTEEPSDDIRSLFSSDDRIKYVAFHDNKGISYAMNYALRRVRDYDFLMTMDQDSRFFPNMMKIYKEMIINRENENPGITGIYSVNAGVDLAKMKGKQTGESSFRHVDTAITSGSMISTKISLAIGGFDENLFIDQVDTEFCYRMKKAGYQIIEFPSVMMHHTIGNISYHHILGYKFSSYKHNAIRKYYIVRNQVYVLKKYPNVRRKYVWLIIKQFIKVTLYEEDKLKKIIYILRGIKDGVFNHMGKLP